MEVTQATCQGDFLPALWHSKDILNTLSALVKISVVLWCVVGIFLKGFFGTKKLGFVHVQIITKIYSLRM